jgi:hypothetical protein
MECLAANRPMLVAADAGRPTTKHIHPRTGLLFQPTVDALAAAIEQALAHPAAFRPREYLLAHTGRQCSLGKLRSALRESCYRTGGLYHFDHIDWDGRNESLHWGRDGVAHVADAMERFGAAVPSGLVDRLFAAA